MQEFHGLTYKRDEIKKLLVGRINEGVIAEGNILIIDIGISKTSVRNYTALLVSQGRLSIDNNTTILKTNIRYTTENSLMTTIASVVTIAYSHYIPIEDLSKRMTTYTRISSLGVQMMYKISREAYGDVDIFQSNNSTSIQPTIPLSTFLKDV